MASKTRRGKKQRMKGPARRAVKRSSAATNGSRVFGQIVLPLAISVCLMICIIALGYLGYQRVSASDFFDVRRIEIVGSDRSSRTAIENIVRTDTERTGVWRSDLGVLRSKIESIPFVRSAAVTRVLPNAIRVQVIERQPVALVKREGRDYLVDADAEILAASEKPELNLPFPLLGWDEARSEKATKDNIERVKLYQRMFSEWRNAEIASKVQSVDLTDLRSPKAIVSDSGLPVAIAVGRERFDDNLKRGIKAIVGKGNMFSGVDLVGSNLVLAPRKQN